MTSRSNKTEVKQTVHGPFALLSRAGLRPTKQRVKLAQFLLEGEKNKHVTAESLFELVKSSDVSVSLATVYNTLKSFCEAGLINEIVMDGGKLYFDTRLDDHPHFFFEDTGEIADAPIKFTPNNKLPQAPDGYQVSKVDLIIRVRRSN